MNKKVSGKSILRTVWADVDDLRCLKQLRKNIKRSFEDPNYTIITNYAIHFKDVEVNVDPSYFLIAYGEEISSKDLEDLKKQIELALSDPNYIIITNYEVFISQYKTPYGNKNNKAVK